MVSSCHCFRERRYDEHKLLTIQLFSVDEWIPARSRDVRDEREEKKKCEIMKLSCERDSLSLMMAHDVS